MATKRHSAEQIVRKLREAEVDLPQGYVRIRYVEPRGREKRSCYGFHNSFILRRLRQQRGPDLN